MRYVVAGYVVILTVLALYAVYLVWRRRALTRAVARVAAGAGAVAASVQATGGSPTSTDDPVATPATTTAGGPS